MIVKTIELVNPYREAKCVCCGEAIKTSEKHFKIALPNNTKWIHSNCYKRLNNGYSIVETSDYNATRFITSNITITCNVFDSIYFCLHGFKVVKTLGKTRIVQLINCNTAYSVSKIIKQALNNNYKVFVDNKEIKSFSEFKELTDTNN